MNWPLFGLDANEKRGLYIVSRTRTSSEWTEEYNRRNAGKIEREKALDDRVEGSTSRKICQIFC